MKVKALNCIDFYKSSHRVQYPAKTEYVYSNFTPRTGKYSNVPNSKGVVFFGLQGFIKWFLQDLWNDTFFKQPLEVVREDYQRRLDNSLGPGAVTTEHIEQLHNLGYLPIKIKALPEGSFVPYGVPVFTIVNTRPQFFWITNYLESVMSAELWKSITSATLAFAYRKRFEDHAEETGSPKDFIAWQAHDFSFRGMSGVFDSMASGAGHLISFHGTDSIPAIDYLEEYYGADSDKEMVGGSVAATEHSVQCMHYDVDDENELPYLDHLLKTFPTGIFSIVADGFDFWSFLTETMPLRKDEIMTREGRVVIRPDSGDPVDIICGETDGYPSEEEYEFASGSPEFKGAYEILWDIFGGTINEKGYKVLDTHVGLIYGDSITLERQDEILKRLEAKGFCASNLVLGVGSYSYQMATRDTHGFAMKATWGQVDGVEKEIFKSPKTGDGMKKSAKGLLRVGRRAADYAAPYEFYLEDQVTKEQEDTGALKTVFEDGKLVKECTLQDVRTELEAWL